MNFKDPNANKKFRIEYIEMHTENADFSNAFYNFFETRNIEEFINGLLQKHKLAHIYLENNKYYFEFATIMLADMFQVTVFIKDRLNQTQMETPFVFAHIPFNIIENN